MSRNIEIKAQVESHSAVRQRLAALPTHSEHEILQTDTFFNVTRGRLKLREFADGNGELLFYERTDQLGPKLSRYDRIPCQTPEILRQALTAALGVRGVIKKRRTVLLIDNIRVHLAFVELEVVLNDTDDLESGEAAAAHLLSVLRIAEHQLVAEAYIDLLEKREGQWQR
jgi:adenylate cyclase class IV